MKRYWLHSLPIVLAGAAFLAVADGASAAENLRYLFLIDHSPEMATRQIASVQIIYDVIRTGFQNEIQPGDKFALWFYGSRLQTNAPFTWQAGHETEIARAAANLFTGRIYSRIRPREQTLADAAPFIGAAPKITVFIVTDGSQPLAGTPFDTAINAAMAEKHLAFLRADKPFVITLMAKNGDWVNGNVFTEATQPFQIPEMERRNDLMEQALAAARAAPAGTSQKLAEGNDIDKARSALRDALSGKAPAATQPPPAPVAKMEFAPALKDPPKPEPKETEKPRPPEEKSQPLIFAPKSAAVEKPNPAPQKAENQPPAATPLPIAPKPVEVAVATPPPPSLQKAPEPKPAAQEQPKPSVREEIKPTTPEPPKPVAQEAPKKIVHDEPKPVVREELKSFAPQIAPSKPIQVSLPEKTFEQPKSQARQNTPPEPKPATAPPTPERQSERAYSPPAKTPQSLHKPGAIQTAAITSAHRFPWFLLAIGFAVIAGGGVIALVRARIRAKSLGSLITQALPRRGAQPRSK